MGVKPGKRSDYGPSDELRNIENLKLAEVEIEICKSVKQFWKTKARGANLTLAARCRFWLCLRIQPSGPMTMTQWLSIIFMTPDPICFSCNPAILPWMMKMLLTASWPREPFCKKKKYHRKSDHVDTDTDTESHWNCKHWQQVSALLLCHHLFLPKAWAAYCKVMTWHETFQEIVRHDQRVLSVLAVLVNLMLKELVGPQDRDREN